MTLPSLGAFDGLGSRLAAAIALLAALCSAHVTLTNPTGGESLDGGSQLTIAWDADDHNCVYNLYFSPDSGQTWSVIVLSLAQTTRSYPWTVPAQATAKGMVRVLQDNVTGTDLDDKSPVFTVRTVSDVRDAVRDAGPGDGRVGLRLRGRDLEVTLGLPRSERVAVLAFDAGGRRLADLWDERLAAGSHRLRLPEAGLPASGPLIFQVRVGDRVSVFRRLAVP